MLKKQLFRRLFITGFILSIITLQVQSSPEQINSPDPIKSPQFESASRDKQGRFTNHSGDLSHGSLPVRLQFYLRRFGTLFRSDNGAPERVANEGAFLRDNSLRDNSSMPTVTWIGHSTLLVRWRG